MRLSIVATILVILGVLIVIGVMRFSFTALPQPGVLETRVANLAKGCVIKRASGHGIPQPPRDKETSIEIGSAEYGSNCSVCHATNGRSQGTPGQWMYPRASDLTSKQVQSYSDQELYWIVQNGIRYTGMPAFGRVETPDHIWGLVKYVRTLANDSGKDNSSASSTKQKIPRVRKSSPFVLFNNSEFPITLERELVKSSFRSCRQRKVCDQLGLAHCESIKHPSS